MQVIQHTSGISINPRSELAMALRDQCKLGIFVSAQAIKKLHDEKLYEELGYETFNEFIDAEIPMSRSQVFICLKVAEKFRLNENKELTSPDSGLSDGVERLGWSKLSELAKLDDGDFKQLLGSGELETGNGKITLADIKQMTWREAAEEIKKIRKRLHLKEEEIKTLKAEAKAKEKFYEAAGQREEAARQKELMYAAPAGKLEERRNLLDQANKLLMQLEKAFFQIDLKPDDTVAPETFKREIMDFIRRIDATKIKAADLYYWLMDDLGE